MIMRIADEGWSTPVDAMGLGKVKTPAEGKSKHLGWRPKICLSRPKSANPCGTKINRRASSAKDTPKKNVLATPQAKVYINSKGRSMSSYARLG